MKTQSLNQVIRVLDNAVDAFRELASIRSKNLQEALCAVHIREASKKILPPLTELRASALELGFEIDPNAPFLPSLDTFDTSVDAAYAAYMADNYMQVLEHFLAAFNAFGEVGENLARSLRDAKEEQYA